MVLGFWQHEITLPNARNLRQGDPSTIKKFNDTLNTDFVKQDNYKNIHYIHNQAIYLLPTHIARAFEILDKLITRLIHAADKNAKEK